MTSIFISDIEVCFHGALSARAHVRDFMRTQEQPLFLLFLPFLPFLLFIPSVSSAPLESQVEKAQRKKHPENDPT